MPLFARALLLCAALWSVAASAEELVLAETPFDAAESSIIVRDLGSGVERWVAALPHAANYGVVGSVSPDGRRLAAVVLESGNRLWRHAAVYVVGLDDGGAPRRLLGEAVFSQPVWLSNTSLIAVRSVGESDPPAADARRGRLMDMDLEVVQLSTDSAAARVLARDRCNSLELAGVLASGEVAVVRSAWEGNSLLALRAGGGSRKVADLGPAVAAWARVTGDRSAVSFQQAAGRASGGSTISQVGVDGARRDNLALRHRSIAPVPLAGRFAFTSADGKAIELLEHDGKATRTLWRDEDAERLISTRADDDGRWLVVERLGEGPAKTLAIDVATGQRFDAGGGPRRWRTALGLRASR